STCGFFVAFTLSQSGMVRHWWRLHGEQRGWRWRATINGMGALTTGVVAAVVGVAKFGLGAWMVLVLVPIMIAGMWAIMQHYRTVEDALTIDWPETELGEPKEPHVIVPLSRIDKATHKALEFARGISNDVTALHVTDDPD